MKTGNCIITTLLITFLFLATGCGEGKVSVTNKSYEPRIVVEGFLFPHQKVERIRIARNFRINANLLTADLVIDDAVVTITDEETQVDYLLTFQPSSTNFDSNYYEYNGSDLLIDYGKTYRLDVSANVEGQDLFTSATTTVPREGFGIVESNFVSLPYRAKDGNDEIIDFEVIINRSPGTSFYASSLTALNPTVETFIYNNPFFDFDEDDVLDDLDDLAYSYGWIQDTPVTAGQSVYTYLWFEFWFYGQYQAILYAADKNFREFLQTFDNVQEQDGNFHEAKFNLTGDGIGVFGSVIADTLILEVTP